MKNKRKKFEKFLLGKNAWNEFVREFEKWRPGYTIRELVRNEEKAIASCFMWDRTPKGREYWENLSYQWRALFNKPSKLDNLTR